MRAVTKAAEAVHDGQFMLLLPEHHPCDELIAFKISIGQPGDDNPDVLVVFTVQTKRKLTDGGEQTSMYRVVIHRSNLTMMYEGDNASKFVRMSRSFQIPWSHWQWRIACQIDQNKHSDSHLLDAPFISGHRLVTIEKDNDGLGRNVEIYTFSPVLDNNSPERVPLTYTKSRSERFYYDIDYAFMDSHRVLLFKVCLIPTIRLSLLTGLTVGPWGTVDDYNPHARIRAYQCGI